MVSWTMPPTATRIVTRKEHRGTCVTPRPASAAARATELLGSFLNSQVCYMYGQQMDPTWAHVRPLRFRLPLRTAVLLPLRYCSRVPARYGEYTPRPAIPSHHHGRISSCRSESCSEDDLEKNFPIICRRTPRRGVAPQGVSYRRPPVM